MKIFKLVFFVLFKIYLGSGPPTVYWQCNLITLIGKTYFYCVQWYWPFWKRMGGFWRRIRKINIDIWIWNQVCASEKLRTAKETFFSQKSICYTKPGDLIFALSKLLDILYWYYFHFHFFFCHPKWQLKIMYLLILWKSYKENHRIDFYVFLDYGLWLELIKIAKLC